MNWKARSRTESWTEGEVANLSDVTAALSAAAGDNDTLDFTVDPTETYHVQSGTSRIGFGSEPTEDGAEWWTATAYDDDSEQVIYEGTSLADCAVAVDQAARR